MLDEKESYPLQNSRKKKIISLIQGLHTIHIGIMSANHYYKLTKILPHPEIEEINSLFGSWSNLLVEAKILTYVSKNHPAN